MNRGIMHIGNAGGIQLAADGISYGDNIHAGIRSAAGEILIIEVSGVGFKAFRGVRVIDQHLRLGGV